MANGSLQTSTLCVAFLAATCLASIISQANGAISVGVESDVSKQTFGMHQPSSSHITYNNRDGINVQGGLKDLLGPPIKMAQGFNTMLHGANMAGVGQSLKSGGAVLGVDARLLETAGGVHMLRGGLLANGAAAHSNIAKTVAGLPGQQIASVVELPVKVIAMKDLATGKSLTDLGKSTNDRAQQEEQRGEKMIHEGNTMRAKGMNQVLEGATQGLQNLGNVVQQTTGNAATALKLLPIMLDMNYNQHQQQQQHQQAANQQHIEQQRQEVKSPQVQQQHIEQSHHGRQSGGGGLTGGSLFGGLSSLFNPNQAGGDLLSLGGGEHRPNLFSNLFGSPNQQNHYAAVLNASNPLTALLMNPNTNPLLLPLNGAMDPMMNPMAETLSHLGQSTATQGSPLASSPFGFGFGFGGGNHNYNNNNNNNLLSGTQTQSFNILPGLKYSETISKSPPQQNRGQQQHHSLEKTTVEQHPQQQVVEKSPPVQQQQQQILEHPQQQQQQAFVQQDATKKI